SIELKRNPDILSAVTSLKRKIFVVGFAAETKNLVANAKEKLINKKLNMIIANKVGSGLG
ncbi:MAG TPA: bifunctional 4'-phosphopantothenoylcysteine decarboxylase/phosphopantothenoylcysteine synthetase, partial [Coxiellaceae bacterium]|nr:bifunctional 4'-phosphopantothenoylcysteine decarboxylase/phosphopantothenoylcysteine synthetase [Coxiellaceae bacterium]